MRYLYTLDDQHRPVAVSDVLEWAAWKAGHEEVPVRAAHRPVRNRRGFDGRNLLLQRDDVRVVDLAGLRPDVPSSRKASPLRWKTALSIPWA
jgi:hypothetical protein